jgi:hypothetical protein
MLSQGAREGLGWTANLGHASIVKKNVEPSLVFQDLSDQGLPAGKAKTSAPPPVSSQM